jgi:hypothetical protein
LQMSLLFQDELNRLLDVHAPIVAQGGSSRPAPRLTSARRSLLE